MLLTFRQAMQAAGIFYSGEIIADGKLHRFHIEGHKRGTKNGAYVLYADGCPAGRFMDYKSDIAQNWRSSSGSRVSYAFIKQINEAKLQRELEIRQKHAEAAQKANYIWSQSKPIAKQEDHPYLVKKRIKPHEARLYGDALVIPIHNESDHLVNLQLNRPGIVGDSIS